ncbi:MAG: DUF2993 domain-containing protein [Anaerolineae bacterium]|jgi:regulator of protease activity HflC (stomatin/prohibitin superfamily)|nr:DUF2993 domain-containing protein [Anaerolineae bacterium]
MSRELILFALLAFLTLSGCVRGEDASIQFSPEGGVDVTITLSESEVNAMISEALNAQANPLLRNPSVDLQSGQMVIAGEHDLRNGSGRVNGTITATIAALNDDLVITITDVQIEGITLDDGRVTALNQTLQERFLARLNRDNSGVRVKSLTLSEDQLTFQVNLQRRNP